MSDLTLNQIAGVAPTPGPYDQPPSDVADQDTFLRLLTTQLQNQDPTSPMENEQFLSQLAQFSSLEQLMGLQQSMDAVYAGIRAMNAAGMANLLGQEVEAVGDAVKLTEGATPELGWAADGAMTGTKLVIEDESGRVVRTVELGAVEAEGTWTWDGLDSDGEALPAGTYTFRVTGTDGDGNGVIAEGRIRGIVDGMDYADGNPRPSIDGVEVDIGNILSLRTPRG